MTSQWLHCGFYAVLFMSRNCQVCSVGLPEVFLCWNRIGIYLQLVLNEEITTFFFIIISFVGEADSRL